MTLIESLNNSLLTIYWYLSAILFKSIFIQSLKNKIHWFFDPYSTILCITERKNGWIDLLENTYVSLR